MRALARGLQWETRTRCGAEAESDKAETSLTDSTMYIQIEECLSVSYDHHSAWDVCKKEGVVRTFYIERSSTVALNYVGKICLLGQSDDL